MEDENKKKYSILILVILQLIFLFYLSYTFYKEYESNKNIYNSSKIVKKYKDTEKKLEKEKEKVLLILRENTNKKNSPLMTLFEQNEEIEKQLKEDYKKYLKDRKEKLKKNKEVEGKKLVLKIESIGLNVKSIPLKTGGIEEIHEKLEEGVIRYSNKDILDYGVTSIYGHSSQPLYTYVDYSFFKKLPSMNIEDEVIFKNETNLKEYKYKTIKSFEVNLDELDDEIKKYNKKGEENIRKYIFLITCYPINTTKKRWVVILENK